MEFRKSLCAALADLMRKDDKVCILDADLSKPNGTQPLYKEFPDRCFNVGIAEANMIGVAAGLAAYGYKPIVFSFTPFATRRVCDQIAVSVAYAKQKIVIIGTDPGITATLNGGTHMSFEDIAVVRSIPSMVIFDAADSKQLGDAIESLVEIDNPVYIRVPRKLDTSIYNDDYKFELFKADVLKHGKDVTVIASGIMVNEALKAVDLLKKENVDVELINVNTIKPLDEATILDSVKKTNHVVVCDNHNIIGGLYSAVCELLCSKYPLKVGVVGVKDRFGQVGSYDALLKDYKMTPLDIYNAVKENLK